ncbi:hypothetical protein Q8A73_004399 [Channa argus]|nr:hypothetical protein Q8A73_004399 [Channa argus]
MSCRYRGLSRNCKQLSVCCLWEQEEASPDGPQAVSAADIQALTNIRNHFDIMDFEGTRFVRVTTSVHSPDGRKSPRKWRVIFSITMDTMQRWRQRGLSEP